MIIKESGQQRVYPTSLRWWVWPLRFFWQASKILEWYVHSCSLIWRESYYMPFVTSKKIHISLFQKTFWVDDFPFPMVGYALVPPEGNETLHSHCGKPRLETQCCGNRRSGVVEISLEKRQWVDSDAPWFLDFPWCLHMFWCDWNVPRLETVRFLHRQSICLRRCWFSIGWLKRPLKVLIGCDWKPP